MSNDQDLEFLRQFLVKEDYDRANNDDDDDIDSQISSMARVVNTDLPYTLWLKQDPIEGRRITTKAIDILYRRFIRHHKIPCHDRLLPQRDLKICKLVVDVSSLTAYSAEYLREFLKCEDSIEAIVLTKIRRRRAPPFGATRRRGRASRTIHIVWTLFFGLRLWTCRSFFLRSTRRPRWMQPATHSTRRRCDRSSCLREPFIRLFESERGQDSEVRSRNGTASSDGLLVALDEASRPFQGLSVDAIQRLLVQRGLDHEQRQQQQQQDPIPSSFLSSSSEKVHGCVANVYLQTIVQPTTSNEYEILEIRGTADALVSRGLVAVLAEAVKGLSFHDLIRMRGDEDISKRLGLAAALSRGRNDGLANMMRLIRRQVQELLARDGNDPTNVDAMSSTQGNTAAPRESNQPTVALLLSGGVDSSVALRLLQEQHYNVTAFYLKIWLEDELQHLGQCPWEDDFAMCQAVCRQANVPLEAISLQQEYLDRVISYTVNEARKGRTPNPDILCNSRIKFGCFYDAIAERGFDFVASGHYAQLKRDDNDAGTVRLHRAPDPVKDQSYFLCALSQEQLQRVLFPVGHLEKAQVRALAQEFDLPNRHRADSQGLCFLGKVKFDEFLAAYLGERPGKIVDAATGDVLGTHRGVWYHTVGQRKGIGKVLDPLATSRGPWYVVSKDPENDIVFVSNEYDENIFTAARSQISVEDIQWIDGSPPNDLVQRREVGRHVTMKVRHGPKIVGGRLSLSTDGQSGDVTLDQRDSGLAPGQYIVFYNEDECLGGGVISEKHWTKFLLGHRATNDAIQNVSAVAI